MFSNQLNNRVFRRNQFFFPFGKCKHAGILKWKRGRDKWEPQQNQQLCIALASVRSYHSSYKNLKQKVKEWKVPLWWGEKCLGNPISLNLFRMYAWMWLQTLHSSCLICLGHCQTNESNGFRAFCSKPGAMEWKSVCVFIELVRTATSW